MSPPDGNCQLSREDAWQHATFTPSHVHTFSLIVGFFIRQPANSEPDLHLRFRVAGEGRILIGQEEPISVDPPLPAVQPFNEFEDAIRVFAGEEHDEPGVDGGEEHCDAVEEQADSVRDADVRPSEEQAQNQDSASEFFRTVDG